MVFISKNINFTTKTKFSIGKTLEMPFFSGKYGFYHEKENFLCRKHTFLRKNITNAVLQWIKWFFISKNINFTSKTHFSKKNYYKCSFTVEKMVFIRKNRNFTLKTRFSIGKTLEMPFSSRKDGFYQ